MISKMNGIDDIEIIEKNNMADKKIQKERRDERVLNYLGNLCTILGLPITALIKKFSDALEQIGIEVPHLIKAILNFISRNCVVICTIIMAIAMFKYITKQLPQRRIEDDTLTTYAKVSITLKCILCLCWGTVFIVEIFMFNNGKSSQAYGDSYIHYPSKNENEVENPKDNNNDLSGYDKKIEEYILKCCQDNVTRDEFLEFNNKELQLIINGIYAYSGCKFSGTYFERFDWYEGTTEFGDFSWENLNNKYQKDNINIILSIKEERAGD